MTRTKHLIRFTPFFMLLAAGALLLTACGPLEFGVEPTPNPPAVPALATVLVTREVTAPPAPTATPTVRATRPPSPTRTSIPTLTPRPTHTPSPTVCAEARISGWVCAAGQRVTISSCCPEWAVHTNADTRGHFEFAALTAGTFTVSSGGRGQTVVLETCYSDVTVNLCPPAPTAGSGATPTPSPMPSPTP